MKIIIHYPGLLHHALENVVGEQFTDLWNDIRNTHVELRKFETDVEFFSRFLLFRNGVRKYTLNWFCSNDDTIIIVAANKQTPILYYSDFPDEYLECDYCSRKEVVYVEFKQDYSVRGVSAVKTYCSQCFANYIRQKAFSNLTHSNITKDSVVDLGFSGERDSSLALHFLHEFRKLYNIPFRINCVFNSIGLGHYDEQRLVAVRNTMKSLLPTDRLEINNLDLPILEVFEEEHKESNSVTARYCDFCVRGTGFRPYGSYIDEDLYISTGAGTIEDKFVSTILNKEDSHRSVVDSRIPLFSNPKRLTPLEGISEDCLAIYASITRINYCIADCPIAKASPIYACRRSALNPIKAIRPWIQNSYGDNDILSTNTIFGRISGLRKVNYPTKCYKETESGTFRSLGEQTIKEIINPDNSSYKSEQVNRLEQIFFEVYERSEQNWSEHNIAEWVQALEDPSTLDYTIQLSSIIQIWMYNSFALVYDSWQDKITFLPINQFERNLLRFLLNKDEKIEIHKLLNKYTNYKNETILRGLQRLVSQGIIGGEELDFPNTKSQLKIAVIDNAGIFNDTHTSLIYDCIGGGEQKFCKIFNAIKSTEFEDVFATSDIVIFVSNSIDEIKEMSEHVSKTSFKGDVIYVHAAQPMTVLLGCFNCLFDKKEICFQVKPSMPTLISKEVCRIQIISIISDIYMFDDFSAYGPQKGLSILYYVNFASKKKVKQVIPCHCDIVNKEIILLDL